MSDKTKDELLIDHNHDGVDRRGFLKCMAWAGTGTFCVMSGGVLKSFSLSRLGEFDPTASKGELQFVQISDSHMGFNKPANQDVAGTLKAAVEKIKGLPNAPEFLLHTGDISHLSKPEEFDAVDQILKDTGKEVFFVPGEHDVLNDDGQQFRERYGKGSQGAGWRSFDKNGVHFVGLVNVMNLKAGGLGTLGAEQLEWLENDLKKRSKSTLNGHIHQIMQKVEGNVTFHTAASTAFPQPAPGKADSPGPMKVPAEQLRKVLGITDVQFVRGKNALAVVDSNLA
jgi:3',5'-cyclic-AMP phosphodiesterase